MIYLAIVGTSHLSEGEEIDARKRIVYEIRKWQKKIDDMTQDEYQKFINYGYFYVPKQLTIVTGDAEGIDRLAWNSALEQKIGLRVFKAEKKEWLGGYQKRNIEIASCAHYVICITTQTKNKRCYHCNQDHQRTGGCWTRKWAFDKLGIPGETIVL